MNQIMKLNSESIDQLSTAKNSLEILLKNLGSFFESFRNEKYFNKNLAQLT